MSRVQSLQDAVRRVVPRVQVCQVQCSPEQMSAMRVWPRVVKEIAGGGTPGGVASEVASVCQWLERPRLGVVAEGSSVVWGVGSTLLWWCLQLVGKGMLGWSVEVARSKGKLGGGGVLHPFSTLTCDGG